MAEKRVAKQKLVGFRMSVDRYRALKLIAMKADKTVAELINDTLEQKFKLSKRRIK